MKRRHRIAAIFATAAVLLGVAGAVAAAHPIDTRPQSPAVNDEPAYGPDGPDTPGIPDVPEPGDTPD